MAGEPGVASFGIGIGYKIGAATLVAIPRVTSVKRPGRSVDTIDATHHKSLGKEFLVSPVEDFGEVTVAFNWMPADETWIDAIMGKKATYTIDFPDGSKVEFVGFGTGHDPAESTVEGKEESTITIKVSGKPDLIEAP